MSFSKRISLLKHILILLVILSAGLVSCDRSPVERVMIKTVLGNITLEIHSGKAPTSAANFLALVQQGTYTNACFYRVVRMNNQPHNDVKIEVIQGGLFEDELVNT